jgi:SAM-dependent methyltransferase
MMNCRHCHTSLHLLFLDLGFAPPSNAYLSPIDLSKPEYYFPLKLFVCENCWLVQTEDYARPDELFHNNYAYYSSTSTFWLEHSTRYCDRAIKQFNIDQNSFVVEVASNDGYLLKNFVRLNIPCLGIEPTAGTSAAAVALGVPVLRDFFGAKLGRRLASEGKSADLIIGNNVYGHVPDINDFTEGLKVLLKPNGTITLEFPHLLKLINENQFDTIYHEHFSYLSLHTVKCLFEQCGLRVWDVEELISHGGSLRVYGCHADDSKGETDAVRSVLSKEDKAGMRNRNIYESFQSFADRVKDDLLAFLIDKKRAGQSVAAYGAAAKGNTLLNYAGVKPDLIRYVCDAAPSKQGKFLPGSHIPIFSPSALTEHRPDWVLILPWNIADEVIEQQEHIQKWGGRFFTAVPKICIL